MCVPEAQNWVILALNLGICFPKIEEFLNTLKDKQDMERIF